MNGIDQEIFKLGNIESTIDYLAEGIEAKAHTPVYKMHKYFARRPQNVFNHLINHYSSENDIILDPFAGGGVTLFEGLSSSRKVVTNDVNPLAAFITKMQTTKVDIAEYEKYSNLIREKVYDFSNELYLTTNRDDTGERIPVRWFEHCYVVECPICKKNSPLSNEHKKEKNGKKVNGWYICEHCSGELKSVDSKRVGTKLLSVTYKLTTRKTQRTVLPEKQDLDMVSYCDENFSEIIDRNNLWVPTLDIPEDWDRQQEDCLHRKGVTKFIHFFTKRNALVMAYMLKEIKALKNHISSEVYEYLLFTFSATLRYTNNLTISTNAWQDGRPVAWAKHAYWLSNQFVEVNPIEYIDKRITAIKSGLKYQQEKVSNPKLGEAFEDLIKTDSTHLIFNQSSTNLPLPNESVDLVLTDPPYGSNVQYGELSAFWLSWLEGELGITKKTIIDLSEEILMHRKKKNSAKSDEFYYHELYKVFSECFRVLKDGKPLVFTFNNKNTSVWLAVLKAALEAGFILEPKGVLYQDPIENYKNTAHTRYNGSLHGDFIYTFLKSYEGYSARSKVDTNLDSIDITEIVRGIIISEVSSGNSTTNDIYIKVFKDLIPILAKLALLEDDYVKIENMYNKLSVDKLIEQTCKFDQETKSWKLKTSQ